MKRLLKPAIWLATLILVVQGIIAFQSTSRPPGQEKGITWCVVIFIWLEIILVQYLYYCLTHCPEYPDEGRVPCAERCFIIFVILQLLLIIALLSCLLGVVW